MAFIDNKSPKDYIGAGQIHFVATCGGGSNQFQGIRLVTSSLATTEQKHRTLQGRIVLTVGNTLSFLNGRNCFGGSFPIDMYAVKEILLPKISTILQGTTQDVSVRKLTY